MNVSLRDCALGLVRPIHVRLRNQKIHLFRKHLIGSDLALLDVGGGPGIAGEFLQLYSLFSKIVVVNLSISSQETTGPQTLKAIADGRTLPFSDRAFDWVFSNAVIEHVGNYEKQSVFANEIRRVAAKGYFVTTPNRYFPIEPHALLPFYQFLPPAWQRRALRFSPGYLRKYEEIHLLSVSRMKALFPEARIITTGFPIFGNSIVACYKCPTP